MQTFEQMSKDTIDHYAKLAMTPGWIDYTRHRVKEMVADKSGLWKDLPMQIKQRIDELKNENRT
jgi:hypothetical protein